MDSTISTITIEDISLGVKKSWINDTVAESLNMDGLFAAQDISENMVICHYEGTVLRTAEAIKLKDKSYLMRLGEQCYIDSKDHVNVLARYINDCHNPIGYNVKFIKYPNLYHAKVVTLRPILCGEELYADYGKFYWLGHDCIPIRLSFQFLHTKKSQLIRETLENDHESNHDYVNDS